MGHPGGEASIDFDALAPGGNGRTSFGNAYLRWLVVYGGDGTHDGATSACGKENFTLTIDNGV